MSYDAASFKAGFALGRMLWRPPTQAGRNGQDTGLGWGADAQFLVSDKDIYLGSNGPDTHRHFYKTYDGVAAGAFLNVYSFDYLSGSYVRWYLPTLVSTIASNAQSYSWDFQPTHIDQHGASIDVDYKGLHWHISAEYGYRIIYPYSLGALPFLYIPDDYSIGPHESDTNTQETFKYIMDQMGIVVYPVSGA